MKNIVFIDAKECYIESFWKAFDNIAKERKFLGTPRAFPLDVTRKFLIRSIERDVPYIFAIDKKLDEVIGWCDLQPKEGKTGSLGIGIIEGYRHCGIGKRLIKDILIKGRSYGFKKVYLEVRKSNENALSLYSKLGFKKIGEIEEGVKIGNMKDDVIQMEMRI